MIHKCFSWKRVIVIAFSCTLLLMAMEMMSVVIASAGHQRKAVSLINQGDVSFLSSPIVFGPNLQVNHDAGAAVQEWPSMAVEDSGALHILWADDRTGDYDVYHSQSADGGITWSSETRVNDDSVVGAKSRESEITMDSKGNLHAVWRDSRNGDYDVFYSHLISGTINWSPNVHINDDATTTYQGRATIAVDSSDTIP